MVAGDSARLTDVVSSASDRFGLDSQYTVDLLRAAERGD